MPETTILNSLQVQDLPEIYAIQADDVLRSLTMGYLLPVSRIQAEKWLSAVLEGGESRIIFAVRESPSGPCIGYVSLADVDWLSRTAEVGIVLHVQGQGHGKQALEALLSVARTRYNLRRLTAKILSRNQRAESLFMGCGFVVEGTLVKHHFDSGDYQDVRLLACDLTSPTWPSGGA